MNTPNNKPGRDMELDIWHILITGELPSSSLRAASTNIEHAFRVKVLMQYFTSKLHQATEEARIDELERIRKSVNIVCDDETDDYPYHCETCCMMLTEKDALCGCEYAIRDRLAQLTAHQNNKDES